MSLHLNASGFRCICLLASPLWQTFEEHIILVFKFSSQKMLCETCDTGKQMCDILNEEEKLNVHCII